MQKSAIKSLLRVIPVLLTGLLFLYVIIYQASNEFLLDEIVFWCTLSLFGLALVLITYYDIRSYSRTKAWQSFLPLITGIVLVATLLITKNYLYNRDNTPVIIKASYYQDFNGVSLELRANGTYKEGEFSLGGSYHRGKYTLTDNLVTLEEKDDKGKSYKKYFIIIDERTPEKEVLYQVNDKREVISNGQWFRVVLDTRT